MNFKLNYSFLLIFLFTGLIWGFNSSKIKSARANYQNTIVNLSFNFLLDGSISGTAEVCLNDPSPQITFSGTAGPPSFTFTYTINGGAEQTITSTGNNDISIDVDTNVAGVFEYTLLSVEDGNGNVVDEINETATITVFDSPTVNFTFNNSNNCSGDIVSFTSNVSGGTPPYIFSWNFGDGSGSTSQNTNHSFDAFGCGFSDFTVLLSVTDDNGCSVTSSQVITIGREPELEFVDIDEPFNPFDNCGNNTVNPDYTINVGNDSPSLSCITSYDVNWGDGSASETNISFPISHTYDQLGSFEMTFTAYGTSGCIGTETIIVKNSSNPQGGLVSPGSTVSLCLPISPLEFAITSWGNNPPDTVYDIDFGDGNTISLTQDQLLSSPYYNSSDPSASENYPIPHEYTQSNCPANEYYVSLDVSTSCDSSNFTAGPVEILEKPNVSFQVPDVECVNNDVLINNTSTSGYNPDCDTNVFWFWDMGDGTTYTDFEPIHSYSTPGTYTISLYAENYCGTTETVTQQICIEPPLNPSFTLDSMEGCVSFIISPNNTTDLFESCNTPIYEWVINYTPEYCGTSNGANFINGTDSSSSNPEIELTNSGIYEITLRATNSCGSFESIPEQIIVKAPPQLSLDPIVDFCGPTIISPTYSVNSCSPANVTYNWMISGGTTPTDWEFLNGTNSNSINPEISFNTVNDYTITLEVTNECDTTSDNISFSILPIPSITNTELSQTICSGSQTNEIIFSSNEANTIFTWTISTSGNVSGAVTSGTGDSIPSHILNLTNNNTGIVTYSVLPSLNGCTGTSVDFVINIEPAPSITQQPIGDSVCLNGTTPPLEVLYTNGTGDPTYQWYSNDSPDTDTPIEVGEDLNIYQPPTDVVGTTYYYVVISFPDDGGCAEITSDIVAIEVIEGITITSPTINQTICEGGESQEFNVTHTDGAGTVTYQWYDTAGNPIGGATSANFTPDPSTFNSVGTYNYYVTISDDGSGCSDVDSEVFTVEVVADPTVSILPTGPLSYCQDVVADTLLATANDGIGTDFSYIWYSNTVNSNSGGNPTGVTSADFTPSTFAVGTTYYYVVVTQPHSGCEAVSSTVEVTVNLGPSITQQPIGDSVCLNGTTPPLEVLYTNGTGDPTYQWYSNDSPDTDTPIEVGEDLNIYQPPTDVVGTTYYYVVISFPDDGGCAEITSDIVSIEVSQVPEISNYSALICSGNFFTIEPNNLNGDIVPTATTYTWSDPVISPSGTITGATSNLTPQSNISQSLINTTTTPAIVTYTVTPTSGICVGNEFIVTVTVNPSISVSSTIIDSLCYLSNTGEIDLSISGGIPFNTGDPYQITWFGPNGFSSNDEDISDLPPGDYTVEINDEGGCPFSNTYTITEPDELILLSIDTVNDISCFGFDDGEIELTISGGTEPYLYSWIMNGVFYSDSEDISNLGPGIYELTVTDSNNCTLTLPAFEILEPDLLVLNLVSQTNVECYGFNTGIIDIEVSGGRTDYTFDWSGPNGFNSNSEDIYNLFAGDYIVNVTDSSGCQESLLVTIIENIEIVATISSTEISCYGANDAYIEIESISGGIPDYDITWSNLGTGLIQENLSAGIYLITITDSLGCVKEFPIEIEEAPIFTINPEVEQISCFGENDASIALNLIGGFEPITVNWSDDATAGLVRNNLEPGTYSVTIADSNPDGSCIIEDEFIIEYVAPLEISAVVNNAFDCEDVNSGSIDLSITGGTLSDGTDYNITWSNDSNSEDLVNVGPGIYYVTVSDNNGCEVTGDWEVIRFDPLEIIVSTETIANCENMETYQIFSASATGGIPDYTYVWSSGEVSGDNGEFMTTNINGTITLTVTDSNGCTNNYSFNVDIPEIGDSGFTTSSESFINYGVYSILDPIAFINLAFGDYTSILWDFGDGNFSNLENPIHTYASVGNYVVTQTITYPFGCVYTNTITLIIEKGYKLIFPNAFTPNEDSLNEYFKPKYIGLSEIELRIYDTWGSQIYYEDGENIIGWNGKVKNEIAENGNYYYTFKGKTLYGDLIKTNGAFTLIK